MWVKHEGSGYVNLNQVIGFQLEEPVSGTWVIVAYYSATDSFTLAGTWPSQVSASEAVRELVDGVDPSTYGD